MLIENVDYFVRVVQFPNAANKGIVCQNADGTFDIYLNSLYPDLKEGYDHEVRHLMNDHFTSFKSIECVEGEADGKIPNVFIGRPKGHIPLFNSLEDFKNYIVPFYIQENPELAKILEH